MSMFDELTDLIDDPEILYLLSALIMRLVNEMLSQSTLTGLEHVVGQLIHLYRLIRIERITLASYSRASTIGIIKWIDHPYAPYI